MDIDIRKLPTKPWVYIFKSKSWKILYIGKTKNLKNRISQYFNPKSVWKQEMLSKADWIEFFLSETESEALLLEVNLINKHKPPYNNLIRWDSSYVYIKITNDDFPEIIFTRYKENDWAIYLWPKYFRNDIKKMLQRLRQILKYRWCKKNVFNKWKICSDYQFWLCKWWCDLKIPYNIAKQQYKEIIDFIVRFFKWDIVPMQKLIIWLINESVKDENYEYSAKLRDIYLNIEKFTETQHVILDEDITWRIYQIKKIWDFFIYIILYFFNGKLIDIYRNKEFVSDSSFNDIRDLIRSEFWEFKQFIDKENLKVWVSDSLKNIWKTHYKIINELINNYIESYIIWSSFENNSLIDEILKIIQQRYLLKNYPYRIECIDISHISWWFVSWWLSCLLGWLINKKWYRQYKINSAKWKSSYNNDYESLSEIIKRKFFLSKPTSTPDLLILDWGKWQLGILKDILQKYPEFVDIFKSIDIVALWKWKARKSSSITKWEKEKIYKFDINMNINEFPLNYDDADRLLIKARDEAHRFANRYRKKQMKTF